LEKHNIRTPTHGSPARPVRYVSHRLNTRSYSPVWAGTMYAKYFSRERVRTDRRWDESWNWRRIAGKQHQGMELASCRQPCGFMPPLGGRLKPAQVGGRSQPEERHNLAAEVLRIVRRRRNPGTGGFWKIFPYPTPFVARRFDLCVRPTPPLVGTRLSTGCRRQCA
jgi:hypothetical protein